MGNLSALGFTPTSPLQCKLLFLGFSMFLLLSSSVCSHTPPSVKVFVTSPVSFFCGVGFETGFLCNGFGCPKTHLVDQADLRLLRSACLCLPGTGINSRHHLLLAIMCFLLEVRIKTFLLGCQLTSLGSLKYDTLICGLFKMTSYEKSYRRETGKGMLSMFYVCCRRI